MNLPVILGKIAGLAHKAACGSGLFMKAHAPELMVSGGLAMFGVTVISACKATGRAVEIMDDKEAALGENDACLEEGALTQREHDENEKAI